MLIQLYQYAAGLVIDEAAKASFLKQVEDYSNSFHKNALCFLTPVLFPSLDELRNP